jgi:hypothetical protein
MVCLALYVPMHDFSCSFSVKGSSREKESFLVQDYIFESVLSDSLGEYLS